MVLWCRFWKEDHNVFATLANEEHILRGDGHIGVEGCQILGENKLGKSLTSNNRDMALFHICYSKTETCATLWVLICK